MGFGSESTVGEVSRTAVVLGRVFCHLSAQGGPVLAFLIPGGPWGVEGRKIRISLLSLRAFSFGFFFSFFHNAEIARFDSFFGWVVSLFLTS